MRMVSSVETFGPGSIKSDKAWIKHQKLVIKMLQNIGDVNKPDHCAQEDSIKVQYNLLKKTLIILPRGVSVLDRPPDDWSLCCWNHL